MRRGINTIFRSRALRALVVQMVEQVRPIVRPPTQAVAPMPKQNQVASEAQVRPLEPPTQAEAPPQVQVTPSDGHTATTARRSQIVKVN